MRKSLLFAFVMLFSAQAYASLPELIDGVKNNNKEAVLQLLKAGENVNAVNEQGNSALHYAVALNNAEMADILLRYGADMNISNAQGWTPLKIVEKKKVEDVAAVLHNALAKNYVPAPAPKAAPTPAPVVAPTSAPEAAPTPAPEAAPTPAPVVAPAKVNGISDAETARLYALVERAKAAVVDAKKQQEELAQQNIKLQETAKLLQIQNQVLTNRLLQYEADEREAEKTELKAKKEAEEAAAKAKKEAEEAAAKAKKEAEEAAEKAKKAAEEAAEKAKKAAEEAKAKAAARKAELEKNAPKPVTKKPAFKPRKSDIDGNIYAGDEEIIYCLSYLGNGENTGMRRAAGFFAASAGVNEARYNQIVQMSDSFFSQSEPEILEKRSDECAKVITPVDVAKQNQIIRSLNSSLQ